MERPTATGRRTTSSACFTALLVLGGCAGTIIQDPRIQGDTSGVRGVARVVARAAERSSPEVAADQTNAAEEIAVRLQNRLDLKGLVDASAPSVVEVVVTEVVLRPTAVAMLLPFVSGSDHVYGQVRVLDAAQTPLVGFEVKASWGGLGDGTVQGRVDWMSERIATLAENRLGKVIGPRGSEGAARASTAAGTAAPAVPRTASVALAAPVPRTPPVASAAPSTAPAAVTADPGVTVEAALRRAPPDAPAVDDVGAVPGLKERGRAGYRDWLTRPSPRAFVIAQGGGWYASFGTKPASPADPTDPAARALKRCQAQGNAGCAVYAVNDRVVYVAPPPARDLSASAPAP
jgi:hypothetical protein